MLAQFYRAITSLVRNQTNLDDAYRAMKTVHAIFHKDGKLIARAERGDRNGYYEFEIVKFEVIGPGYAYEGSPT